MTHDDKDPSRVGRSTYWMYYVGITCVALALYGWGIYEVVRFHLRPIAFGFVIPSILGIYLRVIAGRRCRDIGWSAFLPWLGLVMIIGWGVINGLRAVHNPAAMLGMAGVTMVVSMLVGIADFIFMIVIGCIGSATDKPDYRGSEPVGRHEPARPLRSRAADLQNAALSDRARPLYTPPVAVDRSLGSIRPTGVARPPGFGRRGL